MVDSFKIDGAAVTEEINFHDGISKDDFLKADSRYKYLTSYDNNPFVSEDRKNWYAALVIKMGGEFLTNKEVSEYCDILTKLNRAPRSAKQCREAIKAGKDPLIDWVPIQGAAVCKNIRLNSARTGMVASYDRSYRFAFVLANTLWASTNKKVWHPAQLVIRNGQIMDTAEASAYLELRQILYGKNQK